MSENLVVISGVEKAYSKSAVLKGVDLTAEAGEIRPARRLKSQQNY